MLYWLFLSFEEQISLFNVFRYITFRSGMAALTAFLFILFLGKPFIRWVLSRQYGQAVRDDGPESHLQKQGTPTMGGVLIVGGFSVGTLLWADLTNPSIWMII